MGHAPRGIPECVSHVLMQGLDVGTAWEHKVASAAFANVVARSPDLGHDLAARLVVYKQLCPLDPVHLMTCEAPTRTEAVTVTAAVPDVHRVQRHHFSHDGVTCGLHPHQVLAHQCVGHHAEPVTVEVSGSSDLKPFFLSVVQLQALDPTVHLMVFSPGDVPWVVGVAEACVGPGFPADATRVPGPPIVA